MTTLLLAPGQEGFNGIRAGSAGIAVTDVGGEELDEAVRRTIARLTKKAIWKKLSIRSRLTTLAALCGSFEKHAPEIEKRLRWQWCRPQSTIWRVDETYVKVHAKWAYLYRALDKHGNMIDFYLSPARTPKRRNASSARRFKG